MNYIYLISFITLTLLFSTESIAFNKTPKIIKDNNESIKPNIVLIQVDDFGYDDIAFHGNKIIQTPNLDKLANQSVRFENFYVSSLCAPSRASLLTGRHFLKTGVSGVHGGRDYINLSETLISNVLQNDGYATGMWGKWHSGKTAGYMPWDRGFDEAYYASLYNYFDNTGLMNNKEIKTVGSATSVITDFAINFIKKNQDEPFFAYIPYMAPHNPWRAPVNYIEKYKKLGLSEAMSSLYGMIDNLDHNIGRVINLLDRLKLRDNTIVIFLSDNGPWTKSYRFGLTDKEWKLRNPNNKRGRKGENWQNGIHSPLFISWPSHYEPSSNTELTKIEDLFPTLMEWAGIKASYNLSLDGLSLIPAIKGKSLGDRYIVSSYASPIVANHLYNKVDPTGFYYPLSLNYRKKIKSNEQRSAVRFSKYKLVKNEQKQGTLELFDIENDPFELNDVSETYPDITKKLNLYLNDWYKNIFSLPHALRMPEFQIGMNANEVSQIYASSPTEISENLINTDHYLGNWTNVSSWAKYKVKVHHQGNYQVRLITKIKFPATRTFRLTCNDNFIEKHLDKNYINEMGTLIQNESAYWEDFDKPSTFKSDIKNFILGNITLNSDCNELVLTMPGIDINSEVDEFDQVIAIQLVKLNSV
ncbi:arylsulfatase [Colwellia sp. E2M01]|uniref:arylsulfatase n=1 Tax=Colwellia sp. E2M01 TaxID=2841561 RepID=UPI001C08341C|nr:arylsulfatase [Colwellia sp. E2M01]MBU2870409.1 arylsulfatase [Colwellia sp. E2M01]